MKVLQLNWLDEPDQWKDMEEGEYLTEEYASNVQRYHDAVVANVDLDVPRARFRVIEKTEH